MAIQTLASQTGAKPARIRRVQNDHADASVYRWYRQLSIVRR
jgi:hypothetical protein